MNSWQTITSTDDLHRIIEASATKPQIIFKDSTTCGISAHAKFKLENGYALIQDKADFHYLDLLSYRSVSNYIATVLGVTHQSPQIIIVKNGQPVYKASHHSIDPVTIAANI